MASRGGVRYAEVERESKHARVQIVLDLDGGHRRDIHSGIRILDQLLQHLALYGALDLGLSADADLSGGDDHYLLQDLGIALGQALREALSDSPRIDRLGSAHGVADDALVLVALDVDGHGVLTYDLTFVRESMGGLGTENVREFLRAFCQHGGVTLHAKKLAGLNDHHLLEALFKGMGLALSRALRRNDNYREERPKSSGLT